MKASKELLNIKRTLSKVNLIGIYFLLLEDEVVYVGKTISGTARVFQHINDKIFDSYCWVSFPDFTDEQLSEVESRYILKYMPKYNKDFGRGNNVEYITISKFCSKYKYSILRINKLVNNSNFIIKKLANGRKVYKLEDLLTLEKEVIKNATIQLPPANQITEADYIKYSK